MFNKNMIEQFNKPVDWFVENVKCCANCRHWVVDNKKVSFTHGLAYNLCDEKDKSVVVSWDNYCYRYHEKDFPCKRQENLIVEIRALNDTEKAMFLEQARQAKLKGKKRKK